MKKMKKKMQSILVLVIMIVAIIVLSGCTGRPSEKITPTPGVTGNSPIETTEKPIEPVPSVGSITFDSIDKGSLNTAEIDKPAIFIAGNITDASQFTKWDTNLADKIKNINFDDQLVIAVFQGMMNTSGYEITVKDISQIEGKIKMTVTTAGPIEAVNPVITYPYHVITVKKDDIKIVPDTWEVYTEDGQLLAQTAYP